MVIRTADETKVPVFQYRSSILDWNLYDIPRISSNQRATNSEQIAHRKSNLGRVYYSRKKRDRVFIQLELRSFRKKD